MYIEYMPSSISDCSKSSYSRSCNCITCRICSRKHNHYSYIRGSKYCCCSPKKCKQHKQKKNYSSDSNSNNDISEKESFVKNDSEKKTDNKCEHNNENCVIDYDVCKKNGKVVVITIN